MFFRRNHHNSRQEIYRLARQENAKLMCEFDLFLNNLEQDIHFLQNVERRIHNHCLGTNPRFPRNLSPLHTHYPDIIFVENNNRCR
ncbi:MAG: hypothetical protein FWB72_06035 [Firmicutes bacterium]|nr:hypothetical protein [Bacillota bacterium]